MEFHDGTFKAGLITLVTILVILVFVKCFGRILIFWFPRLTCKKREQKQLAQPKITLTLDIGNQDQQFSLPIMELPFDLQHYNLTHYVAPSGLNITGTIRPKLAFHWPQTAITHKYADIPLELPTHVNLTITQAFKISRLFAGQHYTMVHAISEKGEQTLLEATRAPSAPVGDASNLSSLRGYAFRHSDGSRSTVSSYIPAEAPPPMYPALATETTHL